MRIYLSFFSLYRIIELVKRKRVDKGTFASMVEPWISEDEVLSQVGLIKMKLKTIFDRYTPWISHILLYQGMSWDPTWKSLPTHKLTQLVWKLQLQLVGKKYDKLRSVFTSLPYELGAFRFLFEFFHMKGEQYSKDCLWPSRVRYALDPNNESLKTGRLIKQSR